MMNIRLLIFYILLATLPACKESYDVPSGAARGDILVVEGFLNSNGITSFTLSRSAALADSSPILPERRAVISIEAEGGTVSYLAEQNNGEYAAPIVLNPSEKYRLRIFTEDRSEYLSEFVPVIQAPPIDSINWTKERGDVRIFANTHDPSNNTRYYRWNYEETWEFHSAFYSQFEYEPVTVTVVPRRINDFYICWNSRQSTNIIIGSSARLKDDVISLAPITTVENGSIKLSVKYSILVRQFGLTRDAFEYWERLKKNTEQLGTIFDPQPSANKTNIVCISDPSEMVLGYVSAGSYSEKRIFINNSEVLPWSYRTSCLEYGVTRDSFEYYFGSELYIPTYEWFGVTGSLGFYGASPGCVDCTLRGTNIKPPFWP